ncbi:SDR family NAD(P)-dependent oxidoreductase [Legionella waltersii]|uniref:Sepiapterin reductase n=1 Tax=Legionella waltersii TaxID=66969 RepID=A0A0W1A090_9GAMM|nr:SDR family NAD(P)-dependent oxidoreductase [Legionella waltersii]KTD74782.1 sepiapterin reductase [Legionella waltersii]SNV00437.1 yueD sepiapterin reductase [Legionella waltersii]
MHIITGGGSGIGKSLALALAERGEQVCIIGRRENVLQETASQSTKIDYLSADVSTPNGRELIKTKLSDFKSIKSLVNNAGTLEPMAPMQSITPEAWHSAMNTNIDAALFLPQLLQNQLKNGRVLNIGSGAAYFPIKGWSAYCVSKAALAMLTRCWQLESNSIVFASVKPGIIDTEMQAIARQGNNMEPSQTHFYRRLKEAKRLVSPETVAEFLCWLLLEVNEKRYVSHEWDIYDTAHHTEWLKSPHQVLHWDF